MDESTGEALAGEWAKRAQPILAGNTDPGLGSLWTEQLDQKDTTKVWREPPVDILTFTREFLERDQLSDFHRDCLTAFAGEDAEKWDEVYKVVSLCWGLGCLAEHEVLECAKTGTRQSIGAWCCEQRAPWLWGYAANGRRKVRQASIPFVKGHDWLLRVELIDGRSVTVGRGHKFLARRGPALGIGTAAEFLAGDELCVMPTAGLPSSEPRSAEPAVLTDCRTPDGPHVVPATSDEIAFARVARVADAGYGAIYDLTMPELHNYYDAQGVNHQNSGKNFTAEIFVTYTLYRLLLLVNPHRYFGFGKTATGFIDILNISFVNEDQAKAIFFDRLKNVIRGTFNPATGRNWFAERGVDLRDRGIGDIKEKVILLPRNIRARCLPFTQVGFEGSDILLAIIDEPSRAVTSPPANLRAHKLFAKMLDNTTARYQRRGKVVLFSYPEAEDTDLIVELFDQAGTQFTTAGRRVRPTGNPDVYASMGATYEVNPRVRREDFDSQRRTDPEGVAARIDCRPPHSRTGFYRAWPAKVSASFCYDARNAILRYEVFPLVHQVQQAGQLVSRTYTGVKLLWVRGDDEPRALGGDPGERSDIFALALARSTPAPRSIEVVTQGRERVVSELPVGVPGMLLEPAVSGEVNRDRREDVRVIDRTVVVDGLVEIQPIPFQRIDPKTGRAVADTHPISFVSVRDFILELKQHFPNLHLAGFDRWQSSELVEELIRANIDARNLTFSNQEQFALYSQHRSLTYNDMVRAMPSARAEKEFLDLQEVIPGRKVDHKPEGSKDVSDAIVIAMGLALELAIAGGGDFILR